MTVTDVTDEMRDAAHLVMADDGWTCAYHEPTVPGECEMCDRHRLYTVKRMLAAALATLPTVEVDELVDAERALIDAAEFYTHDVDSRGRELAHAAGWLDALRVAAIKYTRALDELPGGDIETRAEQDD